MQIRIGALALALAWAIGAEACGDSGSSTGGSGTSGGASSGDGSGTSSGTSGSSSGGASSSGSTSSGGTSASGGTTSGGSSGGTSGGGSSGTSGGGSGSTSGGSSGGSASGGSSSGGTPWCIPQSAQQNGPGTDWGKVVIDAAMKRTPSATSLVWLYPNGLLLHGIYLGYKRLGTAGYLSYVKAWADANKGHGGAFTSLDLMMPSLVLDDMYGESMDASYGTVPKAIRTALDSYPRTSDGGFWHNTGLTGQNWGDGAFMALSPLASYGQLFNDSTYTDAESTKQLTVYDAHLKAPNDLHYHAYDEPGTAGWLGETMHHSCCEWCRAEGWYEMALAMSLDKLPAADTAGRMTLVAIAQRLASGLKATQDPATGRWWQVMDMPTDSRNWLETSCSAMHTYFLSRAIEQGYIDATYVDAMTKGFQGVLQEVSQAGDIANICVGTNVGDAAYYFARTKATNDNHGLGAFLLMYDQLTCH
jgi:unsaturated rhamnogalacturonyl hydrolase